MTLANLITTCKILTWFQRPSMRNRFLKILLMFGFSERRIKGQFKLTVAIDFHSMEKIQCKLIAVWLPAFLKISSVSSRRKKLIQVNVKYDNFNFLGWTIPLLRSVYWVSIRSEEKALKRKIRSQFNIIILYVSFATPNIKTTVNFNRTWRLNWNMDKKWKKGGSEEEKWERKAHQHVCICHLDMVIIPLSHLFCPINMVSHYTHVNANTCKHLAELYVQSRRSFVHLSFSFFLRLTYYSQPLPERLHDTALIRFVPWQQFLITFIN